MDIHEQAVVVLVFFSGRAPFFLPRPLCFLRSFLLMLLNKRRHGDADAAWRQVRNLRVWA